MRLVSPGGRIRHRLDDNEIENLYSLGWSRCKIARRLGTTQGTIDQRLTKRGVKFRGRAEAARLGIELGLNNMAKGLEWGRKGGPHRTFTKVISAEGRRKLSEARKRDGYRITGENNPAKRPEVRAKMSASRRAAYMAKHPEYVEWLRRRGREIKALSMMVPQRPPTKPEKRFIELSERLGLPFRYVGDGQFWLGGLNPDFVDVNGRKVAVDILGDYWHSPLFNSGIKPKAVLDERRRIMGSFGWKLVHFWESELRNGSAVKLITKRLEEVTA